MNEWKVDIINMSCGFFGDIKGDCEPVKCALDAATRGKGVLVFAAASNNGGQGGRAYPARDGEVVCVHSTDTLGNSSKFNPTPKKEEINLATVGEGVRATWPKALSRDNALVKLKSGTSYATPLMVAIAVFLLTYVRMNLPNYAGELKKKHRMVQLLRCVARKGEESGERDGFHFVDVSTDADSLFSKEKGYINIKMEAELK